MNRVSTALTQPLRTMLYATLAVAGTGCATPLAAQTARDYISIVGSSTVYPFATVVAENFGRTSKFKTPTIESTGSGGGLKLFCSGIGIRFPDITNSSRRIRASEMRDCASNGIDKIVEVKIGYDGIVIANDKSAPAYSLTTAQIFLALAKQVPNPSGGAGVVANPYERWSDIDASLPPARIEVLGPPPTSGTRDAFLELVMEPGCAAFAAIEALGDDTRDVVCQSMREDGAFVEAGENDNLIVQKLQANHDSLGIFGYSFLEQNADKVKGASVNGVEPTFDTIAAGAYAVSRPLFFYVKTAHVDFIPGVREYLAEFMSDDASGEFGYLSDKGLIPLAEDEHAKVAAEVRRLQALSEADLAH